MLAFERVPDGAYRDRATITPACAVMVSWSSCQGTTGKLFPRAWYVGNNHGVNWQKGWVPFWETFWSPPQFHEHGKDEKRSSLVRKTHKATHASEPKNGLVRKRFGPISSPANNDPAGRWEVRWSISYLCYLCSAGASRKTHHTVIEQFFLATAILVGNSFCLHLVHDVIWNDTTKIVIFCNLHPGQRISQQSKGERACKKFPGVQKRDTKAGQLPWKKVW